MGGGLDGGVMCCFRANCFCDSGTTSFIAIGYERELMEVSGKRGRRAAGCERAVLFMCSSRSLLIPGNDKEECFVERTCMSRQKWSRDSVMDATSV